MGNPVTLLQLRTRVLELVDDTTSGFFTTALVNGVINSSRRRLDNRLIALLGQRYKRARGVITTSANVARYAWPTTDTWTSTTLQVLSVLRVTIQYGQNMAQRIFEMDNAAMTLIANQGQYWGFGSRVVYEADSSAIYFYPTPPGVYTVWVDYIPATVDLVNDGDSMEAFNGFDSYVVADAMCSLGSKENDSDVVNFWTAEKERIFADFVAVANLDAGDANPAMDVERIRALETDVMLPARS